MRFQCRQMDGPYVYYIQMSVLMRKTDLSLGTLVVMVEMKGIYVTLGIKQACKSIKKKMYWMLKCQ